MNTEWYKSVPAVELPEKVDPFQERGFSRRLRILDQMREQQVPVTRQTVNIVGGLLREAYSALIDIEMVVGRLTGEDSAASKAVQEIIRRLESTPDEDGS